MNDPRPEEPNIAVVVVNYESRDLLRRCLTSVLEEIGSSGPATAVRVVDNASGDGSVEMVAAQFPTVHVTVTPANLGYAGGANVALRELVSVADASSQTPRYVLVLNPDTELLPGSLAALVGALDADDDAAVAGPALLYPDGTFQHSAFRFPGAMQVLLDLFPIPRLTETAANGRYRRDLYGRGEPFPVDFPLGACLLTRSSAVGQVGLLDEGYFMYSEEIDWCRRFRGAGYHSLCVPRARVIHHAGATTRRFREEMLAALWSSRLRYVNKHERGFRRAFLAGATRGLMALRLLADRVEVAAGRLSRSDAEVRRRAFRSALAAAPHAVVRGGWQG